MTRPKVAIWRAGTKDAAKLKCDLFGDDDVAVAVGGWEEVEYGKKKRRRTGMAFKGSPAYSITLALAFNGIGGGGVGDAKSVEAQCRRLVAMGRPRKPGGRPPLLRLSGPLRVPSGVTWVVSSIEWGAQVRDSDGRRVQQHFELTLTQHRPVRGKKSPAKD